MATLDNVEAELAERVRGMRRDAASRGLETRVAEGYRSLAEQERLYALMVVAKKEYGANWRKHASLAAKPGTSDHGRMPSTAVDLDVVPPTKPNIALHGMLAHQGGLKRTVAGEYWHLQLDPERAPLPSESTPAPPAPAPQEADMAEALSTRFEITDPKSQITREAKWVATPDGSVRDAGTGVFFGSMHDLKPEQKQGFVSCIAITANNVKDPGAGYVLTSQAGNKYEFNAAQWKALGH